MAALSPQELQELIDWQFAITMQGQTSRYGTLNNHFYKQYLPAGIDVPGRHPPRRIHKEVYELAHRQAEG